MSHHDSRHVFLLYLEFISHMGAVHIKISSCTSNSARFFTQYILNNQAHDEHMQLTGKKLYICFNSSDRAINFSVDVSRMKMHGGAGNER